MHMFGYSAESFQKAKMENFEKNWNHKPTK